jgi:hypothetical protein
MAAGRALPRVAWGALLALLVASGVWDGAREVHASRPQSLRENLHIAAHTSGYSYEGWMMLAGDDLPGTLEQRAVALARFREPHPRRLHFELGVGLIAPRARDLTQAIEVARAAFGESWHEVALGFARLWIGDVGNDVRAQLAALERIDDPVLRESLTESCGRLGSGFMITAESLQKEIDARSSSACRRPGCAASAGAPTACDPARRPTSGTASVRGRRRCSTALRSRSSSQRRTSACAPTCSPVGTARWKTARCPERSPY